MEDGGWMTTDVPASVLNAPPEGLLIDLDFFQSGPGKWIHTIIFYLVCPLVMIVSLTSNLINVAVFISGGLNDGMAANFMGLAISDFLYNAFTFTARILNAIFRIFNERPYLNTFHVSYIMAKHGRVWFNVSSLLTVFAAVQKCACIAIPLTFRNFFTLRKSVVVVVSIYAAVIIYYLPYLSLDRLRPYRERFTNRTRLGYSVMNRQLAKQLDDLVGITNRIALPYVTQSLVIVCVLTMTVKLREAARTRRKMMSGNAEDDTENDVISQPQMGQTANEKSNLAKNGSNILSSKELRVIRSVNILCSVFVAGTTPLTIIEACDWAFASFGDTGGYSSLYFFAKGFQQLLEVTSTAVNIVIYYRFNSKYKTQFNSMFSSCSKTSKGETSKDLY